MVVYAGEEYGESSPETVRQLQDANELGNTISH